MGDIPTWGLDEVLTTPHCENVYCYETKRLGPGLVIGLVYGQVAGTCECGNEPPGSIKCGKFLDC
jgi:hypothetical protein